MPLSDEEERVIAEIERQFAGVPAARFHESVGPARSTMIVPALLSVLSFAMTVLGFVAHVGVGVVGFVSLMVSLMALVRAAELPVTT